MRDREHCREKSGSALPGGYAPESVKAEDSSIVDESGDCRNLVHENQGTNREVSGGKADV